MRFFFTILIYLCISGISYAQGPNVDFTSNLTTACANELISFTNQSTSTIAINNFNWDFGDGSSSTLENPTHSYSSAGTYTVTLVVVDQNGNAGSEVKPNFITIFPSPVISFNISGLGCTVPLDVIFNNTTTSNPNYLYNWDFGNGQSSTAEFPSTITYQSAGTYNVIFSVTDNSNGCTSTDTQSVVVSNFQAGIIAPSTGCVGTPIVFQDNSTAGANYWDWNFGGLATSNNQNPSFTFNAPGVYTIQLSSQNTNSGCSGNTSTQITIEPTPVPSFTASPTSDCAPAQITFTNTSNAATTFFWDFGNGQTYSGQNPPSQTYNTNGLYTVSLSMISMLMNIYKTE